MRILRNSRGGLKCNIELCDSLCCRRCPVLTQDEVAELITNVRKEYTLELDPEKYFRRARGEHSTYFAAKMIKGRCIFLNKEKRCRIYRCRPTLCELYPVIDVDAVDEQCPAIREHKLSEKMLVALKQRYTDEIDENIKLEQMFRFI